MVRFITRFLLFLVFFFASSGLAKADSFDITFTGNASGTGQFTTNGTCVMCSPNSGLLTWVVGIGPDTGANAFDITDDGPATMTITYDRLSNSFSSIGTFNSENMDFFILFLFPNETWQLSTLSGDFSGTYSVTPTSTGVSEPPSSVLLLLGVIALTGLVARQASRASIGRSC